MSVPILLLIFPSIGKLPFSNLLLWGSRGHPASDSSTFNIAWTYYSWHYGTFVVINRTDKVFPNSMWIWLWMQRISIEHSWCSVDHGQSTRYLVIAIVCNINQTKYFSKTGTKQGNLQEYEMNIAIFNHFNESKCAVC